MTEDNVNAPNHYYSPNRIVLENYQFCDKPIEINLQALDVIKAWGLGFHLGNVVKYILRSGKKGEDETKWLEDLRKARYYLDDEIRGVKARLQKKSDGRT